MVRLCMSVVADDLAGYASMRLRLLHAIFWARSA